MDIKVEIKDNTQNIIIEKDGVSKIIHTLEHASNNHFCNYILDKNYLIISHDRKDREGYHYQDVRCVYDINTDEILELSQSTYHRLTNMYVKSKMFNIHTIMAYLLNIVSFNNKDVRYFHDFMSSYNPLIKKEDIKREVIRQYPIIEKYLNPMIYIFNKNKIENDLRGGLIPLFAIKQDVRELDKLERQKAKSLIKK